MNNTQDLFADGDVLVVAFMDVDADGRIMPTRYAIAKKAGEDNGQLTVIDNANGWGYRTKEAAMASYRYKASYAYKKEAIDRKIRKTEEEIASVNKKLEELKKKLETLQNNKLKLSEDERKEKEKTAKAVTDAYLRSGKSAEEVMRFLQS